jgi:hypothetical protein
LRDSIERKTRMADSCDGMAGVALLLDEQPLAALELKRAASCSRPNQYAKPSRPRPVSTAMYLAQRSRISIGLSCEIKNLAVDRSHPHAERAQYVLDVALHVIRPADEEFRTVQRVR